MSEEHGPPTVVPLVDELVHALTASMNAFRLAVTTAADDEGAPGDAGEGELRTRMLELADRESRTVAGALGAFPTIVEAAVAADHVEPIDLSLLLDEVVAATVRRGGRVEVDSRPEGTIVGRAKAVRALLLACCLTASDAGARLSFETTPVAVTMLVEPAASPSSLLLPVARIVAAGLGVTATELGAGVAVCLERA